MLKGLAAAVPPIFNFFEQSLSNVCSPKNGLQVDALKKEVCLTKNGKQAISICSAKIKVFKLIPTAN